MVPTPGVATGSRGGTAVGSGPTAGGGAWSRPSRLAACSHAVQAAILVSPL
jgi:hypothetical protein